MIALGAALELAQKLVPGRSFEWGDMLANTAGVLTGMAAGWVARKHES
jgi:VanZ family protein